MGMVTGFKAQSPIPKAGPRSRIIYRQANHDQQYRQPVQGPA